MILPVNQYQLISHGKLIREQLATIVIDVTLGHMMAIAVYITGYVHIHNCS